jgi:hypothetical protein
MRHPPPVSQNLTDRDIVKPYLYLLRQGAVGKARKAHDAAVLEYREQRTPRLITGLDGQPKLAGWKPSKSKRPRCGAKTRAGSPCKRQALPNGRCPNHGGLSTGPRTAEGKARSAAAARAGWKDWNAKRGGE